MVLPAVTNEWPFVRRAREQRPETGEHRQAFQAPAIGPIGACRSGGLRCLHGSRLGGEGLVCLINQHADGLGAVAHSWGAGYHPV
jgi:hypothetical protein